jgi:hypothetical protein
MYFLISPRQTPYSIKGESSTSTYLRNLHLGCTGALRGGRGTVADVVTFLGVVPLLFFFVLAMVFPRGLPPWSEKMFSSVASSADDDEKSDATTFREFLLLPERTLLISDWVLFGAGVFGDFFFLGVAPVLDCLSRAAFLAR